MAYNVVVYVHDVLKEEGSGWFEHIKSVSVQAQDVSYERALKIAERIEKEIAYKNKTFHNGWKDYFVQIEETQTGHIRNSKGHSGRKRPSALKESRSDFLKVGRHIVELQKGWGENGNPVYDVYVDGRPAGIVAEHEGQWVADDGNKTSYSTVEEAIAASMNHNGFKKFYPNPEHPAAAGQHDGFVG